MESSIINSVISRLEGTVFPVVSPMFHDEINRMLAPQLKRTQQLSALQQQLLIESIVRRYKEVAIKKYEPVGVNAALTTGENLTQSSLQSHHHAGLKRGAAGFDRIEEITNMKNKSNIVKVITSPHRIKYGNTIEYVPRSKIEINELANLLIKILMNDIVTNYEIVASTGVYPQWYSVFSSIKALPMSGLRQRWLRIYLNVELMYKHRISLPAVAQIVSEGIGAGNYVLYPPSQLGQYIDIHTNTTSDADYLLKLSNIQSLQVGGVESVESAVPIPENLLTNLQVLEVNTTSETVYELVSSAPAFVPPFVWTQMIKAMVPDARMIGTTGRRFSSQYDIDRIRDMILQTPIIYADVQDTREEIMLDDVMPNSYMTYRQELQLLGGNISMFDNQEKAIRITFNEDIIERFPYLEHTDLSTRYFINQESAGRFLLDVMVEYHFFWYIEAICEKVQDLYVLPEVDSTRTYTTSPLDCRDNLGYMAMRNMIYREFRDNIGINPIHVKVIINNMTLYKEPVSIRRQSVRNDKSEWMTYTTFEDVLKYITAAAFAGEEDHLQSVSSHVLTGRPIEIGRGGINMPKSTKENPTGNSFLELKLRVQRQQSNRRR